MADVDSLNIRHGISEQLTFKEVSGGLMVAEVANAYATAAVALQGGHLMSWTPNGSQAVIWLSKAAKFLPGKSIRGGVPVCWPWFGVHPTEPSFPAHGFARTVPWEVVTTEALGNGETRIVLSLKQNDISRAQWPYSCELSIQITLGAVLEIELVTSNTGGVPIAIGEALHAYFEVGDVREIAIHGLDGCDYLDKVDGGKRKQQAGPVMFNAETDRVYLNTVADCVIDDPRLGRRIRISKSGSRSTIVWNPWNEKAAKMGDLGDEGYLHMVCVESANAAENLVTIAPGNEHRLRVSYELEPFPAKK